MARSQNKLSPLVVKNLKQKGLYADGGGLYLRVGESGNKSWIFRFRRHGKLRDMGLGALHTITLAEARAKAVDCRKLLLAGIDPLDTKKAALTQAKLAAVKGTTFESCAKALRPATNTRSSCPAKTSPNGRATSIRKPSSNRSTSSRRNIWPSLSSRLSGF